MKTIFLLLALSILASNLFAQNETIYKLTTYDVSNVMVDEQGEIISGIIQGSEANLVSNYSTSFEYSNSSNPGKSDKQPKDTIHKANISLNYSPFIFGTGISLIVVGVVLSHTGSKKLNSIERNFIIFQ